MVDPAAQTTTWSYDAANEHTATTYSDARTPSVTNITYSPDGRRTAMTDGTGTSTWAYDSLNRLTSSTNGAGAKVSYAYDLKGQRTSTTYPNAKTVTDTYDPAGHLSTVSDWLSHSTTFGYDPNANLATEAYPNTTSAALTYNAADQLTSIADTAGQTSLASLAYTRDPAGQLTSTTPSGLPQAKEAYAYSPLEQLASVNTGTFGYDHADNLTRLVNGTTQAFDAANELTTATTMPSPVPDQQVSAPNTAAVSPPVTTTKANELVLAFVSAGGPTNAATPQSVASVTGGGLTWSLVTRANTATTTNGGTAEVWQAYASAPLTGATVTAVPQVGGYDSSISVQTFANASAAVGASATGGSNSGAPAVALTTAAAGAQVWGVGVDVHAASARTAKSGQTKVHERLDTAAHTTTWTQRTTSAVSSPGTLVSLGDTAPSADPWNLVAVEVRPAAPAAPVLDQRVSASATGASSVTSPAMTTTSAGEMVLALVSMSGPHTAAQSATVTGAGLTWTRAAYSNIYNTTDSGTAEVWAAYATSALSGATVTATGSQPGYDASITVATFSGAASYAGSAGSGGNSTGAPSVSVSTTTANSVVWGAGYDGTSATSHTPATGQTMASQRLDTNDHSTQWAQATTSPVPTAGTVVSLGDSAPTTDAWNLVAVEVMAQTPPSLAADQSATTDAVTHSTVVSPSLTTTSANELIVAFVSLAGPAGSAQSVASVTGGGLTWTRAARSNTSSGTYGGSAEVWQAYATSVLSGATVTATPTISGSDGSITVATFTGARSTLGATATNGAATGAPTASLTTTANGSLVWGAGTDGTAATARTAITGQAPPPGRRPLPPPGWATARWPSLYGAPAGGKGGGISVRSS